MSFKPLGSWIKYRKRWKERNIGEGQRVDSGRVHAIRIVIPAAIDFTHG